MMSFLLHLLTHCSLFAMIFSSSHHLWDVIKAMWSGQIAQYDSPGEKSTKLVWDNFFGNPDNGEDSPKTATFLLATLLAYNIYEGWLMKLNSPTNSQEVEIITPWSRSDTVGVSARRKETLCYICSHIYSENMDRKQVMALPHARWGNPWLSHRKPLLVVQLLVNTQIAHPEGTWPKLTKCWCSI